MWAITIGFILFGVQSALGLSTHSSCTCAAMDTPNYVKKETVPLVERSLNVLSSCKPEASKICNKLCTTLANATRNDPEGGNAFCADVKKDITNVQVSVFSKACDHDYMYTGLTFPKLTCCRNNMRVPCETLKN